MSLRPALLVAIVVVLGAIVALGVAGGHGSSAAPARFEPPRLGSPARVWAVGDAAGPGEAPRRVARRIAEGRPELFLYLGDVYPHGTREDFRTYDRLYGQLVGRTAPTIGNHEWATRRSGYDPYWRRALGRPVPRYYSFQAAGWTVLSLNSELPGTAMRRQAAWVRAQVRAGGTCRLAFWHRPRFSAGVHGDSKRVDPLWRALRGRARLVLNGHDHDLQRLRLRDGITELVAGAGGRGRYPLRPDPRLVFGNASSEGALRLDLRPGHARYAFVSAAGRVLHRGSASCRAR
ncbi:MAG: metallophosphoesterase [Actinomycetota bacterium]|nr:metallophosphoesterase [Actinomycetota bacterium]